MSFEIDHVHLIRGELSMDALVAQEFMMNYEDCIPGLNFLEDAAKKPGVRVIPRVWWCDEGSGRHFDVFKLALARTTGMADLLLIWEHGESITGLSVRNGVVTEMDVEYSLVPKKHD
jgi:hypothetical protein